MILRLLNSLTVTIAAGFLLASCGPNGAGQSEPAIQTAPAEVSAGAKPQQVGECVQTTIVSVGPRLEGAPDSGSSVQYANGMGQVSYEVLPAVGQSQAGDEVRVCLVSIPENCPPGDDRGRVYAATNMRTGGAWSAPDSQHMCGGA